MKNNQYAFGKQHMQNIKARFEKETGVQLTAKKAGFSHRKLAAALCAAVLCTAAAMPVLAGHVPAVYDLMYLVSPGIAQFFKPVQKASEQSGIRMEVVSAYIHGDTAEIYVTLQDLTGNRVDGTTDLFDSYSINRAFDSSAFCKRIGYDDATKTATFLISITQWGNRNISGDKITFSVREFISHKKHYQDIEIPVNLDEVKTAVPVHEVYSNGGGGEDYPFENDGSFTALVPSKPMPEFPLDELELTAIGYIDGKLHIQTANADPLSNDHHGFFYLHKEGGDPVESSYSFSFSNQYETPAQRIDYREEVFDIPQDELQQYSLYGDFVTTGMHTEGNWSVTFPLELAESS